MSDAQETQDPVEFLMSMSHVDDGTAITAFFEQYSVRLERIVRLRLHPILNGRVDPSDIVQDAFVEAIKGLDVFLEKRPLPVFSLATKVSAAKRDEGSSPSSGCAATKRDARTGNS